MPDHPFAIQGIDHIVLRVRALPRALEFYRDVLGCVLEREQPELGLTQLRAGSGRNLEHFCLTVAPFDEESLSVWLAGRGVIARAPAMRYGAEGEGRSFYIEDPDGNHIELKGAQPHGTLDTL
jgi:glyoxylase I family protein